MDPDADGADVERALSPRGDRSHEQIVLAGHEDLPVMLLQVLSIEGDVFHEQTELGLAEVLHARAVLDLAVDVPAVRDAENDAAVGREGVLHDATQQIAIVERARLQRPDRDHEIEASEHSK